MNTGSMRRVAGLALVVLGLGVGSVRAEALGADLGVFGAYLDASDLNEAFGVGGKLKLNVAEFFAVDLRGSYLEYDDTEITLVPVEALALLQLPLGESLRLYGGAGVGYYLFDADRIELDDSVGYFPVAGLEVGGEVKLFAEVRWLFLSPDSDSALDELEADLDDGEADADGLGINIGISIGL